MSEDPETSKIAIRTVKNIMQGEKAFVGHRWDHPGELTFFVIRKKYIFVMKKITSLHLIQSLIVIVIIVTVDIKPYKEYVKVPPFRVIKLNKHYE